jgi:L-lactate dehydrogenase complex protein LldG
MTSRDAVLQRIRTELSKPENKNPPVPLPPPDEVWPSENPPPAAMADRFSQELSTVQGEVVRCRSMDDAGKKLAELVRQAGWSSLGAMDRPMVRNAAVGLPNGVVQWAAPDWTPQRMAELSASLVEPEALLADTGSCLIACPTAQDRLLCYLAPACVVIARLDQLREHLPAAWAPIVRRAADPSLTGEFVIVTGPSRTADIEKILILGVHGPKRLVVMLVES